MIAELIEAGVNVFRLNFSHGAMADHLRVARTVREQAAALDRYVGVLADLQGPKIRIGGFREGSVELAEGDGFTLDLEPGDAEGAARRVGLEYRSLCDQVARDDILLLDDGRIRLRVESVHESSVDTTVLTGGTLRSRKGINRLGGGLAAPALTVKDIADMEGLAEMKPDFVAVSFVSSAEDILQARELLAERGLEPGIVAKIERAGAVADDGTLEGIVSASSGIMVARGDLGVEVGDASLIGIQKALISRARKMSAIYAANHNPAVRGIACLTESGATPLLMSRLSSGRPIFALGNSRETLRRLTLCRGVAPLYFDAAAFEEGEVDARAIEFIKSRGYLEKGDEIIFTKGAVMGRRGNTNIMKILPVP